MFTEMMENLAATGTSTDELKRRLSASMQRQLFREAKCFSTFDLRFRYHQVRMRDEYK